MTLRQSQFVASVPLIVATELGLLDQVDLVTTRTVGSADQLRALMNDELDLVVTAIDNLFEWTKAGADLRLLAQVERTTPLGLYSRPGLSSLADLAGGRFAVDAFANGFALIARHILGSAGVEVEFVEVGGVRERLEALLSADADATLLGPPFDGLARGAGMTLLEDVNELFPSLPGQGLIARTGIAESDELAVYLNALHRAVAASTSMSDEEGVALLERHGFQSAAAAAWNCRPRSLEVDTGGLVLLTEIRAGLGLLPGHIDLFELHDPQPVRSSSA